MATTNEGESEREAARERLKDELREELLAEGRARRGVARRDYRDVGGTSGGLAEFFVGAALLGTGGWLLMERVVVTSSYRTLWGFHSGGLALVPIFFGVALLFVSGRSILGWLLTALGFLAVVGSVIADLQLYFRPTTLFQTLVMLGMAAGGLGLVVRSLRAHD